MKRYEIRFVTKKGGYKKWIIHVEASNRSEVKEKLLNMWESDRKFQGKHMFHIEIRLLKDTEEFKYHYFSVFLNNE